MSVIMTPDLRHRLMTSERYFRRACEQVFILNRLVEETTVRFNIADARQNQITRYNVRLRLSVLEGVRNMFYEFAAKKAADIVELQRHILDADADEEMITDDSDSDMSELAFGYQATSDDSSEDAYC
ncbi:hypothetical protein ACF0H5_023134 [Mactra antiquata]